MESDQDEDKQNDKTVREEWGNVAKEAHEAVYENVVTIAGASKDGLYQHAMDWFILQYPSAQDVIQLKDEERGKIIGKGVFIIYHYMNYEWNIEHTVNVNIKDGKYKYSIQDIVMTAPELDNKICDKPFYMHEDKNLCIGTKSFNKLKIKVNSEILSRIESLEKTMQESVVAGQDDSW